MLRAILAVFAVSLLVAVPWLDAQPADATPAPGVPALDLPQPYRPFDSEHDESLILPPPAPPLPIPESDKYFYDAVSQFQKGQYRVSTRMFERLLEAKPHLTRVKVNLAISVMMQGNKERARDLVRQILETYPRNEKAREVWTMVAPGESFPRREEYKEYMAIYELPPGEAFDLNTYKVVDKVNPKYYTLYFFYSSVDRSTQTSIPDAESITGNSSFLVLRKIDINRAEVRSQVDYDSPVARKYKIEQLPHFILLDPRGTVVADGPKAWRIINELNDGEQQRETGADGGIQVTGGDLFSVVEVTGVNALIEVKDYIEKGSKTILDFYAIDEPEREPLIENLKRLVEERDDLRLVRVNIGAIRTPGQPPRPYMGSPNVERYNLGTVPTFQIYDDAGKLLFRDEEARKQIDGFLGEPEVTPEK